MFVLGDVSLSHVEMQTCAVEADITKLISNLA